ncbi:MAG TPA: hypothetical protein H9664_06010, partial [Firmicutes bacterium]|nr:hypothetical protein [Bacillota bacterium]
MAKKAVFFIAVLYIVICCASCTPQSVRTSSSPTETAAAPESSPMQTVIDQENPFEWLEEYDRGAVKGYDVLNITGVDALGRVINTAEARDDSKTVGIFYNA